MSRTAALAFALAAAAFAPAVDGATARLTFTRVLPAPHDLGGAQSLAVVYAIGDSDKVTAFVEHLVEYIDRSGTMRVENAVENNQHLPLFDAASVKRLRRDHPADAYVGVSLFTCNGVQHSAEGSERDSTGERIRRVHVWVDASCEARLDLRGADGRRMFTLRTRGEGTSPRATSLSDEERDVAFEQAARYAALNAADMITPRLQKETIELDDSAPDFDAAMAMINSDQLREARSLWESDLRTHRNSAPLLYDLGAVCEAIGDYPAAHRYLQSAVKISPSERRYRDELLLLQRRSTR